MPKPVFHPEELALLTAIHTEPRDDTPRLVYADWLQEHGEAGYAAFIRWQTTSRLLVRYALGRRDAILHSVVTSSRLDPDLVDHLSLPPGSQPPRHILAALRPFPRVAMLGAPHVWFDRGLPVARITGTSGSLAGFDTLTPTFHPAIRIDDIGITLDRLVEPIPALLAHPLVRRADSLRVDCADVERIERFAHTAQDEGLLDRVLSLRLRTDDAAVAERFVSLLKPIHPVQRWRNWHTVWLREQ